MEGGLGLPLPARWSNISGIEEKHEERGTFRDNTNSRLLFFFAPPADVFRLELRESACRISTLVAGPIYTKYLLRLRTRLRISVQASSS